MSELTSRQIRAKAKRAAAQPVMQLDELRWFLSGCANPPREVAKRTAWRYTRRKDWVRWLVLLLVVLFAFMLFFGLWFGHGEGGLE